MLDKKREYYNYIWFIKESKEVFYVGKGKGNRYKTIRNRNKFFKDIYNSHECDVKIVAENLTEQEALDNEVQLIKWYRENTDYRLTNQTNGGDGISGYVMSNDIKRKISCSSKQMWQNENFRHKMIEIRRNPNGKYQSKEFKKKISILVSGSNNPNYKNYWSEEQKRNLSIVRKRNKKSLGINNSMAKKIICIETGEVFDLMTDAMKKYNMKSLSSLTIALKKSTRTAYGYHWCYYREDLLDENKRLHYYLNALGKSRNNAYICVETKKIYPNQKMLNKNTVNVANEKFNSMKDKNGTIIIDNKTYMLVSYYINSPCYWEQ